MYKPAFTPVSRLLAALALLTALSAPSLAQDRYRAEVVVLERLADPILEEQMAARTPQPAEGGKRLLVVDASGSRQSDLNITGNLTLNQAASRLENSGKYRVLMKAGWSQSFPQNYNGEPLTVEVGDYLEAAGHRAVEGTIEINRRRYLLVNVQLNHWREVSGTDRTAADIRREQDDAGTGNRPEDSGPMPEGVGTSPAAASAPYPNKELVTWIRETRRMRSEEIHFVDSPTIGVLIYFRPLD